MVPGAGVGTLASSLLKPPGGDHDPAWGGGAGSKVTQEGRSVVPGENPGKRMRTVALLVAVLALTASGLAAAGVSRAQAASWWVPPVRSQPWQWELDHPLNLSRPGDMGTDDTLPNGKPAPSPVIYDIDGIINPTSTVAALHARGKHVVCYIEVGAAGNYYTAAEEHTATTYYRQFQTAGLLGTKVPGYPERYLDITSTRAVSIVESMIDHQCAAKNSMRSRRTSTTSTPTARDSD